MMMMIMIIITTNAFDSNFAYVFVIAVAEMPLENCSRLVI